MPPQSLIRYHLDESCDLVIARGLRLRGVDVSTSQEAGLLGAEDAEQLAYAHSGGRALFTHDGDFIGLHRSGIQHSGILYCHQQKYPLGELIRRIVLVWEVYGSAELVGRLEYL